MGILGMAEKEFIQRVENHKRVWYRIAYGYLGSETLALDAVDKAVYQDFLHRWQLRQPEFSFAVVVPNDGKIILQRGLTAPTPLPDPIAIDLPTFYSQP